MLRMIWIPALLLFSLPVLADAPPPQYDRVNLSEQAETEIRNDLMVASLSSQHQGRNVARLAERVNQEIGEAVKTLKNTPGIKVSTQNYRTQPVYDKSKITAWRVSQSIRLESTDSKLLGEVLGTLQENLKLQSLGYQVSPQERRRHVDEVLRTALQRFKNRAQLIAGEMNKKGWRLVRLNINDGGAAPVPMMRAEMMSDMAMMKMRQPVSIESGTSRLTVQVSGEVELLD